MKKEFNLKNACEGYWYGWLIVSFDCSHWASLQWKWHRKWGLNWKSDVCFPTENCHLRYIWYSWWYLFSNNYDHVNILEFNIKMSWFYFKISTYRKCILEVLPTLSRANVYINQSQSISLYICCLCDDFRVTFIDIDCFPSIWFSVHELKFRWTKTLNNLEWKQTNSYTHTAFTRQ